MVDKGAPLSEQEADTLSAYLLENFGIRPEPVDAAMGQGILERSCTSCHSLNGIEKDMFDSPSDYRDLISRMISHGATLKDEEVSTLAQYLFATYGTK